MRIFWPRAPYRHVQAQHNPMAYTGNRMPHLRLTPRVCNARRQSGLHRSLCEHAPGDARTTALLPARTYARMPIALPPVPRCRPHPQTNAKLDMSLSLRRAPPCPLHRVRVDSTALKTREFAVDGSTTVLALKQSILEAHCKGVHRWVDEAGQVTQVSPYPLRHSEATRSLPSTLL